MEDNWCVVRFKDKGKRVMIAPGKLVRLKDGTPFHPTSAKDLPGESVMVKWQQSLTREDFSSDGYYEASVLAIGGSIATAKAKALELCLKLPPCCVIDLPANSYPIKRVNSGSVETESKLRVTRGNKPVTESEKPKKRQKLSVEKETLEEAELGESKATEIVKDVKVSKQPSKEAVMSSPPQKKLKVNKPAKDKVSGQRLTAVKETALKTNPLLVMVEEEDNDKKATVKKDLFSSSVSTGLEEKPPSTEVPLSPDKDLVKKDIAYESEAADEADDSTVRLKSSSSSSNSSDSSDSSSSSDAPDSSDSSNSSDSAAKLVDQNALLVKANGTLKKQNERLEQQLEDLKRDLNLVNGLRCKYKEDIEKLQKQLQALKYQNEKLSKNNLALESGKSTTGKSPDTKKGKDADKICLDDPDIQLTCTRVHKHFTGEEKMEENAEKEIHLGHNVFVKKEAFEKNFKENRLNLLQSARNLTAMTWDEEDRAARSLKGGRSNKHPEATPKIPATPIKVKAILGAVKGHLHAIGEIEGPSMLTNLEACRKTIGTKLASDGQAYMKKQQLAGVSPKEKKKQTEIILEEDENEDWKEDGEEDKEEKKQDGEEYGKEKKKQEKKKQEKKNKEKKEQEKKNKEKKKKEKKKKEKK